MKRKILYILLPLVLISCAKEATVKEPHSEAELSGLTLATSNGTYYQIKYSQREDVKLYVANIETDAIQAVRQGKADVYVSDEVMLTSDDQKRLGMKQAFLGEECFDVAFALKKGNTELMKQLNAFLATAPLHDIIEHWIHEAPYVEEPPYEIKPGAKPLRCVTGANISPISFLCDGGEWKGIDADILRRFAHSQGRPFEMRLQDLGVAIIGLETGQADVVSANLIITEERAKSVDFSNPYYKCHPGYFVVDRSTGGGMAYLERLKMNLVTENRWRLITDGLAVTLIITLCSILFGSLLGIGVCACRRSKRKGIRKAADLYSDFINGIPTLVLLLIMFYIVFASSGLSATIVAIITFSLCFASSSGNIFDSAISSVPIGQTEAGLSLGFTPYKTFTGIVFPQAVCKGMPLYIGECIALLKNTSIVGYIAIQDLTRASDLIRSRTFDALVPLLIVTILYFVLAWLIRRLLLLIIKKQAR